MKALSNEWEREVLSSVFFVERNFQRLEEAFQRLGSVHYDSRINTENFPEWGQGVKKGSVACLHFDGSFLKPKVSSGLVVRTIYRLSLRPAGIYELVALAFRIKNFDHCTFVAFGSYLIDKEGLKRVPSLSFNKKEKIFSLPRYHQMWESKNTVFLACFGKRPL